MAPRSILVTGANGYIGSAVARAFSRDGWIVYGLVRRERSCSELSTQEIIPVLGAPGDFKEWAAQIQAPEIIVSATEDLQHYEEHYNTIIEMASHLASLSKTPPLLIFTSGCKDFGMTRMDGDPELQPSTEESALNAPPPLADRARCSNSLLQLRQDFDVVVTRPTTVYGLTSSYYSSAFTLAEAAKAEKKTLVIPADPASIMHGCHVDDCGDAYVMLAKADRKAIVGESYCISGHRYETAKDVAAALAAEYGIVDISYQPEASAAKNVMQNALFAFSQWVSSDKLRKHLGWRDVRPLFSENVRTYRLAFEAYRAQSHESVERVNARLASFKQS